MIFGVFAVLLLSDRYACNLYSFSSRLVSPYLKKPAFVLEYLHRELVVLLTYRQAFFSTKFTATVFFLLLLMTCTAMEPLFFLRGFCITLSAPAKNMFFYFCFCIYWENDISTRRRRGCGPVGLPVCHTLPLPLPSPLALLQASLLTVT